MLWGRFDPSTPIALADRRDIVLVVGHDPYAWKGTENIAGPHVRPGGEGGGDNDRNAEALHHDDDHERIQSEAPDVLIRC